MRCPTGLVTDVTVAPLRVAVAAITFGSQGEHAYDQAYIPAGALYVCVPLPVFTVIVAGDLRNDNTSTWSLGAELLPRLN